MDTERLDPVTGTLTVRQYMSPSPVTITARRPLSVAESLMREHGIRHLPVLDGGAVVGLVSQRDLLLVQSMPGVNPTVVLVEEAMVQNVFQVGAEDALALAVDGMIERKVGSAVVVGHDRVVGVLTTVDALRALRDLLRAR